jgi:hypothetical protein
LNNWFKTSDHSHSAFQNLSSGTAGRRQVKQQQQTEKRCGFARGRLELVEGGVITETSCLSDPAELDRTKPFYLRGRIDRIEIADRVVIRDPRRRAPVREWAKKPSPVQDSTW